MTTDQKQIRLEKKGYTVKYLMNTCDNNRGKCMVLVGKDKYTSISSAHKNIFGY